MRLVLALLTMAWGITALGASNENNWSCREKISSNFRNFLYSHNKDLDYAYGSGRKNLDLFYHRNYSRQTPLVVFFHGGGFTQGDKCNFFKNFESQIRSLLQNNVAVASVNYSFLVSGDGRGATRAFDDGKQAFRLLQQVARWRNINLNKVILSGKSAGAGIAMAVGLHDDYSDDVAGLLLLEAQASYSTHQLSRVFNSYLVAAGKDLETVLRQTSGQNGILWHLKKIYGTDNSHKMFDYRSNSIARQLNLLHLMDSNDPPIYVENVKESNSIRISDSGNIYHHQKHADLIADDARRAGIDVVKTAGKQFDNESVLKQNRLNFIYGIFD